jgi:hypothetical protein
LSLRPAAPAPHKSCRHPLYLRYGAILPSSLALRYARQTLDYLSRAPVSDLGTVLEGSSCICFHCLLDSGKPFLRRAVRTSYQFSPLRHSPKLEYLDRTTVLLALSRSNRSGINELPRHWSINQFPIRATLLRLLLGPANSRLTTHCRETLALAVAEILTRLCCYYRQDLQ